MQELELWYFYGDDCRVCHALWPKVKALIDSRFPKVHLRYLNAKEHLALAGQHRMLAIPGILFFVEGREHFRANGLISLQELDNQIAPAYHAYFEEL